MRGGEFAAELEFGEGGEEEGCCVWVGVSELEVVQLGGLVGSGGFV